MEIATIVRRKQWKKEISEAEAKVAEAYATINAAQQNPGGAVNALSDSKIRTCYHCRDPKHFISQCPRKAAGLPPTVVNKDKINNTSSRPVKYNGPRFTSEKFPRNEYKKQTKPLHKQTLEIIPAINLRKDYLQGLFVYEAGANQEQHCFHDERLDVFLFCVVFILVGVPGDKGGNGSGIGTSIIDIFL